MLSEDQISIDKPALDALKKVVDSHFSTQKKDLQKLREEVEDLNRGRVWRSYESILTPIYQWTSPASLSWTQEQFDGFGRDVNNGSALLSTEVAAIRAEIERFKKKAARRRSLLRESVFHALVIACVVSIVLISALTS